MGGCAAEDLEVEVGEGVGWAFERGALVLVSFDQREATGSEQEHKPWIVRIIDQPISANI